ncbi:MAG: DUF364 domain-containing protein [Gammaproteobacteria bacterium]|nr:DUF364 domain-containing protein [Gammaproteobacteria bacterium]
MSIRNELFALAVRALEALPPLHIRHILIADPRPAPDREAEFGLLSFEDGSVGLYYAWLGESQSDMRKRFDPAALRHQSPLELARYYLGDSDAERSVGLAAINAVTDAVYRAAGHELTAARDSMGGLTLEPDDRLGMIGNFPSLVRRARDRGVEVNVVERKQHMIGETSGVRITLDPGVLRDCNKIICTGATLLNDSLDEMLAYCTAAEEIALIGPTVGFFPDPVFARGIDIVGGTRIIDADRAAERLETGKNFGDSAARTVMTPADYPGFERLLENARAGAVSR